MCALNIPATPKYQTNYSIGKEQASFISQKFQQYFEKLTFADISGREGLTLGIEDAGGQVQDYF